MRHLLVFLLSMIICANTICVRSQTHSYSTLPGNVNIIRSAKVWTFILFKEKDGEMAYAGKQRFWISTFLPDTVISGKKYRAMSALTSQNTEQEPKKICFRENNGRIYRYYDDTADECLVCDFNLQQGSIFHRNDGTTFEVTEVTTYGEYPGFRNLESPDRRLLRLRGLENPADQDVWIEGVGSIHTGILDRQDLECDSCALQYALCEYNQELQSYDLVAFDINTDFYKSVCTEGMDISTDEDLSFMMDFLSGARGFEMTFTDDTLKVRGAAMLGDNPSFIMDARIDGNNISLTLNDISISPLFSNIYLFEAKIPGIEQGTYKVNIKPFNGIGTETDTIITCGNAPTLKGDVNSDNAVDISDIVAVINVIAGTDSNDKADVNADGKTDISDIVAVINSIAK